MSIGTFICLEKTYRHIIIISYIYFIVFLDVFPFLSRRRSLEYTYRPEIHFEIRVLTIVPRHTSYYNL